MPASQDVAYFESKYASLKNDFLRQKSTYNAANDRCHPPHFAYNV